MATDRNVRSTLRITSRFAAKKESLWACVLEPTKGLESRFFTNSIEQSRTEIQKMGDGCSKMLGWLSELVQQDEPDKLMADRLKKREQVLDSIQDEIAVFITNFLSSNVPHSVADEARRQLRMADEYESVSDYIADLDKFDRKLRRDGLRFTEQQRSDLVTLNSHAAYLPSRSQRGSGPEQSKRFDPNLGCWTPTSG